MKKILLLFVLIILSGCQMLQDFTENDFFSLFRLSEEHPSITDDSVVYLDYQETDLNLSLIRMESSLRISMADDQFPYFLKSIIPHLSGLTVADTYSITLNAAEAYGKKDPKLVIKIPVDKIPESLSLEIGHQYESNTSEGTKTFTLIDKNPIYITADFNPPCAGKAVIITVTIIKIASPDEMTDALDNSIL